MKKKKKASSLVGVLFDTDRNGEAPTATVAMVTCSRARDFSRVKTTHYFAVIENAVKSFLGDILD